MKVLTTIILVLAFCVTSLQQSGIVRQKEKKVCQKALKACGEFSKPEAEVGEITCKVKKCFHICTHTCPRHFELDNTKRKHIHYSCKNGKWVPSHETFCKAVGNVHTVHHKLLKSNLDALAALINELFSSSYTFLSMSAFYGRADVSLPGFEKLMTDLWSSDQNYAREVMKYVNKRGAPITLTDIRRSPHHEQLLDDFFNLSLPQNEHAFNYTSRPGQKGVKMAIETNKQIVEKVQSLITSSLRTGKTDPNTKHFLEHGLLSNKVKVIKKLADVHNMLRAFPDEDYSLGEYMVDQDLS